MNSELMIPESHLRRYIIEYPFYPDGEFQEYDFSRIADLFIACADHLRKHALPVEIKDFGENFFLDREQVLFFKTFADSLKKEYYSDEDIGATDRVEIGGEVDVDVDRRGVEIDAKTLRKL